MPLICYKDRSVPLSSFVNLDRSLPSKSISLHVPGNCYLVTVSAAVAIGCAVDWGRRTESPFWWWVLLHQLRMRRRSRAPAQVVAVMPSDCEEYPDSILGAASQWVGLLKQAAHNTECMWGALPYSCNKRTILWQAKLGMCKEQYPVAVLKEEGLPCMTWWCTRK